MFYNFPNIYNNDCILVSFLIVFFLFKKIKPFYSPVFFQKQTINLCNIQTVILLEKPFLKKSFLSLLYLGFFGLLTIHYGGYNEANF